jgi:hypothetical protein
MATQTIVLKDSEGNNFTFTIDAIKLDELAVLAAGDVAVDAQMHVKQLGVDYYVLAGKFFTTIEDNLTSLTTTNALSATQGRELKRLIDFEKRATRTLFYYEDLLSVTEVATVLSVVFPAGTIAMPDYPAYDVLTATVSDIPDGGGIKLSYNIATTAFTYSVVSSLAAYVEGVVPPSGTFEFIIARNIGGKLETHFASLRAYIYGLA